ncbi:unnamed protein product [Acanthoscelides obtectus]|uniref:Nucleosome assembly protein 1-like 1 n=1 Tax=Acanthoscelides obtectus TaxID=200917 RepID=A0A9P0LIG5_ACAOB|nr:unnamed protein product [Acanthoscelides obtectus]CAK1632960.1 Nucleosome assembly protein 1-like 1 [Acanthoscelides obtectus]
MATTEQDHAGDCPEDVESCEDEEKQNGGILDTRDDHDDFNAQNAEWLALLPPAVKRRIKALKRIQLECTKIEAEFYKEVHALECKYFKKYIPLYEKRDNIVNGIYEPTDEEAQWPSDDEDELPEAIKEKIKLEMDGDKKSTGTEDMKGVPEFWLRAIRNISILGEMVQPHDVPILKHLTDIKTTCREDPMGFTLEFHFSPNEYFTNTVLTKDYEMKCAPEEDEPFAFEGPEIYKCTGCTINWNKGKNVTLKTIKKKQKHKSRGTVRTVTKTIQNDSFFNFFNPPTIPGVNTAKDEDADGDIDEDLSNLITSDFEIGHYIRERIVPRAVWYFTGECIDDDDLEEEEEEEEDDDSDGKEGDKDKNCKQQ